MERTFLLIIILVGIGMIILMSAINGTWRNIHFSDYHDDAEIYNRTALAILERGSFHEEGDLTVGAFRRAPGYPLFLAFSYVLFGKSPISAFIMQSLVFIAALVLIWRIASAIFPYPWRLLPPLLCPLFWFLPLQATIILPELLSLFLLLVILWSFQRFFIYRNRAWMVSVGAALAWLILIKPITLYILPFIILLLIFRDIRLPKAHSGLFGALALFLLIPFLAIGVWIIRSIILFDTWQIQSGSYVLGWKSLEATQPWRRVGASFIGGLVGDLFADRFVLSGYAANPEPYQHIKIVFNQMRALEAQGVSEAKREKILYREARERIKANPIKFFVAGITGFLRQNTPMNHRGQAITHLFAENTRFSVLSESKKMAIIVAIRGGWYILLALIGYGVVQTWRAWRSWGIILVWILLYNILYAFFTHNEARYMIPVWPFYLLLLTSAVIALHQQYAKRLRTSLS